MTNEPRGKSNGAGSSGVRSSAFRREEPPEGGTTNASDRLQPLLAAMLDGQLTAAQIAELRRLLADDPAARRQYVRQVATHGRLQWIMAGPQGLGGKGDRSNLPERPEGCFAQIGPVPCSAAVPSEVVGGQWPEVSESEISNQKSEISNPEPLIPPIIIDTGDPLGPPRLSLGSSLGGWLFSYAAATVIMAMLALGAWVYKVSSENSRGLTAPENGSVAKGTAPGTGSPRLDDSEVVGRITGTADCRWAGPQNVPTVAVPVGRKYELASGLIEISYTSGAKVILQGPCAYEVDSPAGGFLSLGKLTADGLPLCPFPLHRQDAYRHCDRPGDGVRRRGGQVRRYRVPRLSGQDRNAVGRRR